MLKRNAVHPCSQCGGVLDPFVSCNACGTATVFADLGELDTTLACPECRTENPTLFACRSCKTRSSFAVATSGSPGAPVAQFACPICGAKVEASASMCPACGADFLEVKRQAPKEKRRPVRRLRGEYGEEAINDVARVPGVGRARAEELCKAGYTAAWQIKAAAEEDLAAIPGVGPGGAKTIRDSLRFVLILPRRRTKEQLMGEEHACPLCGCVVSLFAPRCHDCGAEFEPEEIEDALHAELAREGDKAELAFYEVRLMEDQGDPDLWYARGLLLRDMGQLPDALASFDRAIELTPKAARILLARANVFSLLKEIGKAAKHLRETVEQLLPSPASIQKAPRQPEAPPPRVEEPVPEPEVSEPVEEDEEGEVAEPSGDSDEFTCPDCGEAVAGGVLVCPYCNANLEPTTDEPSPREAAEAMPEEKFSPLDELERMLFKADESPPEEAPPEEELTEEASPEERPSSPPRERVTQGRAILEVPAPGAAHRIPQAIVRRGLVNGRGLINGRGRVNGLVHRSGFVNGAELTLVRLPRSASLTRFAVLAGAVLMAVAIGLAIVPPPTTPPLKITVDGNLADWDTAKIPLFTDAVPSPNPDIAIRSYGLFLEGSVLSVRVTVAGTALGDTKGLDAFYLFLDTDGNPNSGYRSEGLGAEAVLEIDGGNGTVIGARLYEWRPGASDRYNWSDFRQTGNARAVASGPSVEAQFSADLLLSSSFRARVYANDFEGHQAIASVQIGPEPSALLVTQSLAPPSGIVAASGDPLLRLRFDAFGRDPITASSATFDFIGRGVQGSTPVLPRVVPGVPAFVDVPVSYSPADVGASSTASVTSVTAVVPVTISGGAAVAYLGRSPAGFVVDGYFGDWTTTAADSDPTPISNPSVDIGTFATALSGTTTFVYADATGEILGGMAAPEIRIRTIPGGPGGPGGSPGVPPRRSGEDLFRAFIDVDSRDTLGMPILNISADYLLEVRGMNAKTTSVQAYRWTGTWQPASLNPRAENGGRQIEASIDLTGVTLFNMRIVLQVTDWSGRGDSTNPALTTSSGFSVVPLGAPVLSVLSDPPGVQLIEAPALSGPLTLDGSCDDPGYAGAGLSSSPGVSIKAGTSNFFAWICITATSDITPDLTDKGTIHFDTNHGGGTAPQPDDRRFSVSGSTFTRERGNGVAWVSCSGACDGNDLGASLFSGHPMYEFSIAFTDVWGTSSPAPSQRAGFAVIIFDATVLLNYTWGSTTVDTNVPNTWGHIDIPEFHDLAIAAVAVLLILVIVRRVRLD